MGLNCTGLITCNKCHCYLLPEEEAARLPLAARFAPFLALQMRLN